MLSRRLLRIKVLQIYYSHNKVEGKTIRQSENDLLHSVNKSNELYHFLILLLFDVKDYAWDVIELARQKKRPSPEDLNPNTRFIDNQLIKQLETNQSLLSFPKKHKLSWANNPEIVKKLYHYIVDTETYSQYMNEWEAGYESDKKLVVSLYQDLVLNFEELYLSLEEQSIYWLEDIDFIIKMVIKSIRKMTPEYNEEYIILADPENKEDIEFARVLLRKAISSQEIYIEYIEEAAKNWELERIAEIDRMIMILAITEAVEFSTIPSKVTMNEFIEIAKNFSTRKSSQFINGILDSVFEKLRKEKKIKKSGRGLIGENEPLDT